MKQQGMALVIALVMLLLMSMVTIVSVRISTTQEKIAFNGQDKEISFQMSEAALRAGERWLDTLMAAPTAQATCSGTPCVLLLSAALKPETMSSTWWQTHGTVYAGNQEGARSQPRYVVQLLKFVPDSTTLGQARQSGTYHYRITARGTGATDQSASVVQSTYSVRL